MAITNGAIRGLALDESLKSLLVKLNDATAVSLDITSANISLEEKAALQDSLAATATRERIEARSISLPMKYALLAIAGV